MFTVYTRDDPKPIISSNYALKVKRYFGDCFWIGKKDDNAREPSHLVFHNDERGPYLEIRRWMHGSGLYCYSSDVVHPKHIWFGILCMQEMWKGYEWFKHRKDVVEIWRKCMTITPNPNMPRSFV